MATEAELSAYLNEHVYYELLMLRYSLSKLSSAANQLEWNGHFVSFGVHARNLYKFLRDNDGNRKATEYAPKFVKPKRDLPPLSRWELAIFHMGKSRPAAVPDGKLTAADAATFANWIEKHFAEFVAELNEPYRSKWREPPNFKQPLSVPVTSQPSATNHAYGDLTMLVGATRIVTKGSGD